MFLLVFTLHSAKNMYNSTGQQCTNNTCINAKQRKAFPLRCNSNTLQRVSILKCRQCCSRLLMHSCAKPKVSDILHNILKKHQCDSYMQ